MTDQERLKAIAKATNELRNFTCQMTRHMPLGIGREVEKRVAALFELACPEAAAVVARHAQLQRDEGYAG